jgi:hypothetical protein
MQAKAKKPQSPAKPRSHLMTLRSNTAKKTVACSQKEKIEVGATSRRPRSEEQSARGRRNVEKKKDILIDKKSNLNSRTKQKQVPSPSMSSSTAHFFTKLSTLPFPTTVPLTLPIMEVSEVTMAFIAESPTWKEEKTNQEIKDLWNPDMHSIAALSVFKEKRIKIWQNNLPQQRIAEDAKLRFPTIATIRQGLTKVKVPSAIPTVEEAKEVAAIEVGENCFWGKAFAVEEEFYGVLGEVKPEVFNAMDRQLDTVISHIFAKANNNQLQLLFEIYSLLPSVVVQDSALNLQKVDLALVTALAKE